MFSVAIAADAILSGSIVAVLYRGRAVRNSIHSMSTSTSSKEQSGLVDSVIIYVLNSGMLNSLARANNGLMTLY